MRFPRRRFAARPARAPRLTKDAPAPSSLPALFAAHNQHDEFARLKEAERNGTITKEDKIKLDEWRRKESEGGSRGGSFGAFSRCLFCSSRACPPLQF